MQASTKLSITQIRAIRMDTPTEHPTEPSRHRRHQLISHRHHHLDMCHPEALRVPISIKISIKISIQISILNTNRDTSQESIRNNTQESIRNSGRNRRWAVHLSA